MIALQEPTTAAEVIERARVVQRRLIRQRAMKSPPSSPAVPSPPVMAPPCVGSDMPVFLNGEAAVIAAAAAVFGITPAEIRSPFRLARLVVPRYVAIYVARTLFPEHAWPLVGQRFRRDHSTVFYAFGKAKRRIETDRWFAAQVENVMRDAQQLWRPRR